MRVIVSLCLRSSDIATYARMTLQRMVNIAYAMQLYELCMNARACRMVCPLASVRLSNLGTPNWVWGHLRRPNRVTCTNN